MWGGVRGGRQPEAHTGLRGKTWCSGTCWCPEAQEEAEGAAGPREWDPEEGQKKTVDGKKKKGIPAYFLSCGAGLKCWTWLSSFYIPLVNTVWNFDCSYFEPGNSSGALQLLLVQQSHEGLLSGCKVSKDKDSGSERHGQKIITEFFRLSAHIWGQKVRCHTLFSEAPLQYRTRFTGVYITPCDLSRLNPCTWWKSFIFSIKLWLLFSR